MQNWRFVLITDADLRKFTQFPKLTAVNFEAQAIGDDGLQVLKEFPHLKQVGFHYMGKAEGAHASPDFITAIDGMRDLEIIEIKHNFRMKAINVEQLQGPFPNVWRLVLDTPITAKQSPRCGQSANLLLPRQFFISNLSFIWQNVAIVFGMDRVCKE